MSWASQYFIWYKNYVDIEWKDMLTSEIKPKFSYLYRKPEISELPTYFPIPTNL